MRVRVPRRYRGGAAELQAGSAQTRSWTRARSERGCCSLASPDPVGLSALQPRIHARQARVTHRAHASGPYFHNKTLMPSHDEFARDILALAAPPGLERRIWTLDDLKAQLLVLFS